MQGKVKSERQYLCATITALISKENRHVHPVQNRGKPADYAHRPRPQTSPVTSLTITVQNYAALLDLVRNEYSGRLIDILDITTA
ncbi:MAG: hypothetical protein SD837_11750 [Candidatus Electrothrix scaldis]|nr:MAG: hypothetical protein SD837_11750 [Candidatus Electrothrix sp. GW3-3]